MTDPNHIANTGAEGRPATTSGQAAPAQRVIPPPALIAIALYLLLLAMTIVVGVVSGHGYPPLYLFFSVFFITACGGALMLFRWGWAMALAAVVLLAGYNFWIFASQHQPAALVQGSLNTVFFLYLVRPELRERLR
ncbi:MAG TPA: hypothetical protein VL991_09910 [Terracidiphilus sp.]|jgi:hypothetical protein|nr:hypothetical protein [Terracidiphilus sp.]